MKLTKEILKELILEVIEIGAEMEEAPKVLEEISDFILSIPSDPENEFFADQAALEKAVEMTKDQMKVYSDFVKQLHFNMKGKINRKYGLGPAYSKSQEFRNMTQFMEYF